MRPDDEIRHDVEKELAWDPSVDERRIGVAVLDGIVTLTGEVGSLWERWNAQRVVERVKGVRGVANELDVRLTRERTDTDIARAAAQALEWNVAVPSERVQVKVENGWLVLTGEVESGYQRRAAEDAVRGLAGVRGISNIITVRSQAPAAKVKERIRKSFERNATLDASRITVTVDGGEVTLLGSVRSWAEREEAERAAWAVAGVTAVHDYLRVDPLA